MGKILSIGEFILKSITICSLINKNNVWFVSKFFFYKNFSFWWYNFFSRWAINQREAAACPRGLQGLGLHQLHLQEVRGAHPAGRSICQGRGETKLIQPVFIRCIHPYHTHTQKLPNICVCRCRKINILLQRFTPYRHNLVLLFVVKSS